MMMQQQQHPQTSSGGAFGGGGGGGEPGRVGLTRFRSAPATWFDTLLQDDESLMSNQSLPPIPATDSNLSILRTTSALSSADPIFLDAAIASSGLGFFRQNSSPADFLAEASLDSDGFFSNFGIPANLDHPPLPKNPANKLQQERGTPASAEFSSQLEGEQSVQLPGGVPSFTDVDMDKLLDESVPFRVRAKRGCATHPRSIAERVRRTRISDRIRKLQELVPNMDKQTNTADMLDEAVEYVKSLQKQIQELTENQRKCKCSIRE